MLFSACISKTNPDKLITAIENSKAHKVYTSAFYMSISPEPSNGITNMFAQGEVVVDKSSALRLSGSMTQYAFGDTDAVNLFYEDGRYYSDIPAQDIKSYVEIDEFTLREQFIFAGIPRFDYTKIKSLKSKTEDGNISYSFKIKSPDELSRLLGENTYLFTDAGNPDHDRTSYSDAECVFVVDQTGEDPIIKSFNISYIVTVYNKKPYVPGIKYDDKDFRFDNLITLRMSFKSYGQDAVIKVPEDLASYIHDSEVSHSHNDE